MQNHFLMRFFLRNKKNLMFTFFCHNLPNSQESTNWLSETETFVLMIKTYLFIEMFFPVDAV